MAGDDHLCNSHAAADPKRLGAQIDKDYADFAAIVGIDRAGRIQHRDAVLRGEPGARPHLRFGAGRQRRADLLCGGQWTGRKRRQARDR